MGLCICFFPLSDSVWHEPLRAPPWLGRRGLMRTSHSGQSAPKSHSLHVAMVRFSSEIQLPEDNGPCSFPVAHVSIDSISPEIPPFCSSFTNKISTPAPSVSIFWVFKFYSMSSFSYFSMGVNAATLCHNVPWYRCINLLEFYKDWFVL